VYAVASMCEAAVCKGLLLGPVGSLYICRYAAGKSWCLAVWSQINALLHHPMCDGYRKEVYV